MSEYALYFIIKIRACMFDALHMILLKWELVVTECSLYDIIKLWAGMCLNALNVIIKMTDGICLNAISIVLLISLLLCVWMRLICNY